MANKNSTELSQFAKDINRVVAQNPEKISVQPDILVRTPTQAQLEKQNKGLAVNRPQR